MVAMSQEVQEGLHASVGGTEENDNQSPAIAAAVKLEYGGAPARDDNESAMQA